MKLYVTLIWEKGKFVKHVEEGLCHEIEVLMVAGSKEISGIEVLWLGELERRTYSAEGLKAVKISVPKEE